MGGMRGSSHKRVPVALKLPQLQVSRVAFHLGKRVGRPRDFVGPRLLPLNPSSL